MAEPKPLFAGILSGKITPGGIWTPCTLGDAPAIAAPTLTLDADDDDSDTDSLPIVVDDQ